MRFFSICLESDQERVANVKHNKSLIPELEIFLAIEGKTNQLEFYLEERPINAKYLKFCKRGELACMLTHLEIWKKIVRENIDEAVILEDDAVIDEYFIKKFEIIHSKIDKDYDFLYLFIHPDSKKAANVTLKNMEVVKGFH